MPSISSYFAAGSTAIILLSTFLVMRWMRRSFSVKSGRGGLMKVGGGGSPMFHQHFRPFKTRLPFGAVKNLMQRQR